MTVSTFYSLSVALKLQQNVIHLPSGRGSKRRLRNYVVYLVKGGTTVEEMLGGAEAPEVYGAGFIENPENNYLRHVRFRVVRVQVLLWQSRG